MCARLTVLSDEPMASAIAGCVNPYSRSNTIFIRSRCFSGTFFHRRSAVFNRQTSDLLHLTICPSQIRWNQRITLQLLIAITKPLALNFRKKSIQLLLESVLASRQGLGKAGIVGISPGESGEKIMRR